MKEALLRRLLSCVWEVDEKELNVISLVLTLERHRKPFFS